MRSLVIRSSALHSAAYLRSCAGDCCCSVARAESVRATRGVRERDLSSTIYSATSAASLTRSADTNNTVGATLLVYTAAMIAVSARYLYAQVCFDNFIYNYWHVGYRSEPHIALVRE